MDQVDMANAIRNARLKKGKSQKELAKDAAAAGILPSDRADYIGQLENPYQDLTMTILQRRVLLLELLTDQKYIGPLYMVEEAEA